MALMPDVPRASQNTFICYSKLPRGGGNQPIEGSIPCTQSPSFSSYTGIASISGSLKNENIEIAPTLSGGSAGWNITGKVQMATGTYSFQVTVKTNGESDKYDSVTQTFTFYVVLYGAAVGQPQTTFRQYYVGQEVDESGLVPSVLNPIMEYGVVPDGGAVVDENGNESGLIISKETTSGGTITAVHLRGTASRVGTYLVWTRSRTWDEGGQYDHLPSSFKAGDGHVPTIISIYKKFDVNTVIVTSSSPIYTRDPNFIRMTKGGYEAACNGVFNRSGDKWTRSIRILINEQFNLYQVYEYEITLSGSTWTLWGRRYLSDESPGAFESIATEPQWNGSLIPPSGDWSDDVTIIGDTCYFIESYGFFDNKGFSDKFQGWRGSTLTKDEDGNWFVNGIPAAPIELKRGTALPYSPATAEYVGSHLVRDLQFQSLNFNQAPSPTTLSFVGGGTAGGFWQAYPIHRQIIPPNGTNGTSTPEVSGTFRIEHKDESSHKNKEVYWYFADSYDVIEKNEYETTADRKNNYIISINPDDLKYATRDGDLLKRLFIYDIDADDSFTLNKTYDMVNHRTFWQDQYGGFDETTTITERSEKIENLGSKAELQLYIGSGRPSEGKLNEVYSTGWGEGSGSWKIKTTRKYQVVNDGEITSENTTESESTIGASDSFVAEILKKGIGFPSYRIEIRNNSTTATELYHTLCESYNVGGDSSKFKAEDQEISRKVTITHTAYVVYENGEVNKKKSNATTYIKKETTTTHTEQDPDHPVDVDTNTDVTEDTNDSDWDGSAYRNAVNDINISYDNPIDQCPTLSPVTDDFIIRKHVQVDMNESTDEIERRFSS